MQSRYSITQRIDSYQAEYRQLLLQHRRSLVYKEVKNVKLDCSFLPNSRWGLLGREPAWLLYMDFQISQPGDNILENATVDIVFQQDGPRGLAEESGFFVTEHLGPRIIDSGVLRSYGGAHAKASPGSFIQRDETWTIRGSSWPLKGDGTGLCRRAEWVLERANNYNSFRLGLVLQHDMEPFWVGVSLEGQLKGKSKRWYRVRRWMNRESGVFFKVTPSRECQVPLDDIAVRLDRELTSVNIENYYRRHGDFCVMSRDPLPSRSEPLPGNTSEPSIRENTTLDYTIAWICALPVEMAAAEAMLDEVHKMLPIHPTDKNQYTLGRMGEHNVVVVCLPHGSYGPPSAAVVAAHLRTSFRNIRAGLMVGIGGGVPLLADIRLGDVVVSKPTGIYGGVVKYDFGKRVGPHIKPDGMLNKPPQTLLTATAVLGSKQLRTKGREVMDYVDSMFAKYPDMREEFASPDQNHDRLFQTQYKHIGTSTDCEDCDPEKLITRPPRASRIPKVHHGLIGSGNQLMRNAVERDRVARELGILCFEMEAAGLMDHFPCLVIRGISDYSDSHKNKRWQGYAAATAAGYAKALLSVMSSVRLHAEPVVEPTSRAAPQHSN